MMVASAPCAPARDHSLLIASVGGESRRVRMRSNCYMGLFIRGATMDNQFPAGRPACDARPDSEFDVFESPPFVRGEAPWRSIYAAAAHGLSRLLPPGDNYDIFLE